MFEKGDILIHQSGLKEFFIKTFKPTGRDIKAIIIQLNDNKQFYAPEDEFIKEDIK